MKTRCNNPNAKSYHRYGGRGISVCDRWSRNFWSFVEDMYPTYKEGLTLDRVDNMRGYEPSNCRWATTEQQHSNKENNVKIGYNNRLYTEAQLSKKTGINRSTLQQRRSLGWTDYEIVHGKPGIVRDGIDYQGINYKSITELSRVCGIKPLTLAYRLRVGWGVDKAVETPTRKRK